MEAKAIGRHIRMSPRKVRQVIDSVRGKSVEEAVNILHYSPKKAARPIEKVLRSAVANALDSEEGGKVDAEDLVVKSAYVDAGRSMRRRRPGFRGRPAVITKRSSHISITVTDEEEE